MPSDRSQPYTRLVVKVSHDVDMHMGRIFLTSFIQVFTLFLATPLTPDLFTYTSHMTVEAQSPDGVNREYSTKAVGTLEWFITTDMQKESARLMTEVNTKNIISIVNQMVRDERRYVLKPTRPDPVVGQSVASLPRIASDVDSPPESKRQVPGAYAIVVGIEQYRQNLPKADYAAHDAKIMGEYLTKTMGYAEEHVVVLKNDRAARTDLEKYIEKWLPNRVEKGDSVFVYFSGHGAPNPKTGDAYLVPYDGDPTYIDTTGYPLKRLYEALAKLPTKETVVMLDSCFSGAGGRSVIAKGMRPMVLSMENSVLAGGKTVVLAASSGDQVSSTYDAKGHGLFTYFFLKGLQGEADRNKDGTVELSEVFEYLKPQVERVARREFNNEQTPQLLGSPELLKGVRLVERTK